MITGKNSFLKGLILFVWTLFAILSVVASCFCPYGELIAFAIIGFLIQILFIVELFRFWSGKTDKFINLLIS